MISIDLSKIPNIRVITILIVSFSIIVAPFWFIFQFAHTIYKSSSLLQLLFICISVGFPMTLFNFIALSMKVFKRMGQKGLFVSVNVKEEMDVLTDAVLAALFTILFLYAPLIPTLYKYVQLDFATLIVSFLEISFIGYHYINKFFIAILNKKNIENSNTPTAPADHLPPNPHPETPSGI